MLVTFQTARAFVRSVVNRRGVLSSISFISRKTPPSSRHSNQFRSFVTSGHLLARLAGSHGIDKTSTSINETALGLASSKISGVASGTSSNTTQHRDETQPIVVNDPDAQAWDSTADVVVVGFGSAGAVAAIQARELGVDVLAIDRFGGGGTTAYSGGVIYAGGTKYQLASGHHDTAEEMYKYLNKEGCPVKPETLRRFCDGSNGDIEWLSSLGVPFGTNAYEGKASFPPNNYFLYYSGNEQMPNYTAIAEKHPRGHRMAVNGFGGELYYSRLNIAAKERGVKLLVHTVVTRLITDSNNCVIGVEVNSLPESKWKTHQAHYKTVHPWLPFNYRRTLKALAAARALESASTTRKLIRARHGVVLTTGGFNRNEALVEKYKPALTKYYDCLLPLGSIGDDGSGLTLGASVGGATDLMSNISVARTLVPPAAFTHGMLVNKHGKRFVNEAAYAFFIGRAILDQPDGHSYVVMQASDFWKGVWKSFFPGGTFLLWGAPALMNIFLGGTKRARTLEKLAGKIGVDSQGMRAEVEAYNLIAKTKVSDPMGKTAELVQPVVKGPFYAVNMSLGNRFAPAQSITMGGLVIDEDSGLVKKRDGSLVHGLYAAGRVAVGICSGGFVSGMALADTIFSGRRAARGAVLGGAEKDVVKTHRTSEKQQVPRVKKEAVYV